MALPAVPEPAPVARASRAVPPAATPVRASPVRDDDRLERRPPADSHKRPHTTEAEDEDEDNEDFDRRPKKRARKKKGKSNVLPVVLLAAGGAALLLGIVVTVAVVRLVGGKDKPAEVAAVSPPAPSPVPTTTPPPPPDSQASPVTPPVAKPKPAPAPSAEAWAALYGPLGGEQPLPSDSTQPSVPLRARKADTFYTLSNPRLQAPQAGDPRFGPRFGPRAGQVIAVDWTRASEGPNTGVAMVIRTADGKDMTVQMSGGFRNRAGTIELEAAYRGPWTGQVPKNCELYMIRTEGRYGVAHQRTFKVSNSVILGETQFPITQPRDWTAEEAARFRNPPPEGPRANANPGVGEDTEMVGSPGSIKRRYAEVGKPLVGVEWRPGSWDKEDCLGGISPIYDRDFPDMGSQRLVAKPGYAVGGMTVKTKRYVNGVRVVFMRVKSDGTLDPSDSYTSSWLGPHQVGTKEVTLGGDGRRVIGLHIDQAGVLNALALVMENDR